MIHKVNPIECIIPPHMLREIAQRGTPAQQARAVETIQVSGQMRGQRSFERDPRTRQGSRGSRQRADCLRMTYQAAGELFGIGSLEQQAVLKGWMEVGIEVEGSSENPGCLPALAGLLAPSTRRK